eukprot:2451430-Amphidinium_carterae.1
MGGMRVHDLNLNILFAMLPMDHAHLPRAWTMALPFNRWLVPQPVGLSALQATTDNTSQQQPLHNYSYIDTTLTTATPHSTMTTRTSTGHTQRP